MKFGNRMDKRNRGGTTTTLSVPSKVDLAISTSLSDLTTAQEGSSGNAVVASPSRSLGIGAWNMNGKVESFSPSPTKQQQQHQKLWSSSSNQPKTEFPLKEKAVATEDKLTLHANSKLSLLERIEKHSPVVFKRALSSFIRVADLNIDTAKTISDLESEESFPNFHQPSSDPPPGVDADPNELWIALDNGEGEHAPIAPIAITALAKSGLYSAFDQSMWNPDSKTAKLIKMEEHAWQDCSWEQAGRARLPREAMTAASEKEVLVWSGNFTHGRYGSELPAVRSAGLINMPAEALMELLVDSSRAKEYNKMSLGRQDLLVLQDSLDGGAFGGITKVMRSETRPPLVRKTLSFTSILHCRKLNDDAGFKLVSRAVTSPVDASLAGSLQSEILLSVNIIKKLEGNDNQCLMITVTHIRSPMVPMMIAKRIGVTAAVNFINDLRGCC